jgi:hypothetical protein
VEFEQGPVIYCIDGGSSMRNTFDHARALVKSSVVSLAKSNLKFNLLLAREDGNKFLSPDFLPGGEGGSDAVTKFLSLIQATGATDMAGGLREALSRKPGAIVVLASKPIDDAAAIAEEAGKQGIAIHGIQIWSDFPDPETTETMEKLAKPTGGKARSFGTGQF